jgi:hypothetical protein
LILEAARKKLRAASFFYKLRARVRKGWVMKIFYIAGVAAVLLIASLALAKLSVPNVVLGKVEGALDFCAQADPQSADKYKAKKKEFAQGATDEELAEARDSQDYKDAYQSSTDEMSKQSKDEAKKSCVAARAGK